MKNCECEHVCGDDPKIYMKVRRPCVDFGKNKPGQSESGFTTFNIRNKIMSKKVAIMCFSALILGVYIGEFSISETNQYCEMVKIYIDSDGQNGWPDYNRNYAEVCNVDS